VAKNTGTSFEGSVQFLQVSFTCLDIYGNPRQWIPAQCGAAYGWISNPFQKAGL